MRIIIIGAGVSGLSSYLLLKKYLSHVENLSIQVYEAYDVRKLRPNIKALSEVNDNEPVFTPVAIGSAIGIGKNGLNVIRRMDNDGNILRLALQRGNPITAWRMSNARGWTLATVNMVARDDSDTSITLPEKTGTLMIARQDLWEVVRDEALKDEDVIQKKRVKSITLGDSQYRSQVLFDDGTSDDADLIIGADGLRSVLRRAMFEPQPKAKAEKQNPSSGMFGWLSSFTSKTPSDTIDYITPNYEGLGGFGGFIPTKELTCDKNFNPSQMNIVFGANGFFGYGCISSSQASTITADSLHETNNTTNQPSTGTVSAWWSTFSTPNPYPYRQTSPSSNPTNPTYTFNSTRALSDLITRHKHWSNPAIQRILSHASAATLTSHQYYPTWTTLELPTWHTSTAVLIGDAAHALQPSSGQGASQALEDAEALALLLAHYSKHGDTQTAVSTALDKFEALRKPRVHMIYERSQKMGKMKSDMGFVMEMVMYAVIYLMSLFHDKYNDIIMNYDLPREVEKIIAAD